MSDIPKARHLIDELIIDIDNDRVDACDIAHELETVILPLLHRETPIRKDVPRIKLLSKQKRFEIEHIAWANPELALNEIAEMAGVNPCQAYEVLNKKGLI